MSKRDAYTLEEEWRKKCDLLVDYVKEHGKLPPQVYAHESGVLLGAWVSNQRTAYRTNQLKRYRIERLEAVDGWYWGSLVDNWDRKYDELCKYMKEHNRVPAHLYASDTGLMLGSWIDTQRMAYKRNSLCRDRIERLEAVDGWSWYPLDEKWEDHYKELCNYVKEHNRVPAHLYASDTGLMVGAWMRRQIVTYKRNSLCRDRIERLEAVDGWSWRCGSSAEKWDRKYDELCKYMKEHNRVPAQAYVTNTGVKLGMWINVQRIAYKRNKLDAKKIAKLEAVDGWYWGCGSSAEKWDRKYGLLVEYVNEHKRLPVTSYVSESGLRLGAWIYTQKQMYKQKRLESGRMEKLEALPCWRWRCR